jgi:exonuclease VII small subunit
MNAMEESLCAICRKPTYFYTREETARQIECILRDANQAPAEHRGAYLDGALTAFARGLKWCMACETALEDELEAATSVEDLRLGMEVIK